MGLSCLVQHHGLDGFQISNYIYDLRRCILQFSYAECQVKQQSLKGILSVYQTNFNNEENDGIETYNDILRLLDIASQFKGYAIFFINPSFFPF